MLTATPQDQSNGDPYGIRTRVTAVKGRCLNRLTKGPMAPQVGLEPTTDRLTADSSTTELLWINKKIARQRPTLTGRQSNYHRR